MIPLALYCKSYSTDLKRVMRLAASIQTYNFEKIPFHVSVPEAELPLFRAHLRPYELTLHADEDILKASPHLNIDQVKCLPGSIAQQIVKSEFWRLDLAQSYLCLDSDALFIKPFKTRDFLTSDGTPYTVMGEGHEILEQALRQRKDRILTAFEAEAHQLQHIFNRVGRTYNFGPFPLVWHRAVWESLDQEYLRPRGMSFFDAIQLAPLESRWYGEALLKYQAIPLNPCEPFFKVYHYAWQLDQDLRYKINLQQLSRIFSGVIYQSSWEREMDWPKEGGSFLSHLSRRLRRKLGRI